jgi:hypothetical protein
MRALRMRSIRSMRWHGKARRGLEKLKLTWDKDTFLAAYETDTTALVGIGTAHRLGRSILFNRGHSYGGWYKRFGQAHPDWFALQPDGTRKQEPPRERLCVSNDALVAEVAEEKIKELEAHPNWSSASVSPNDGSARQTFCMCEACRACDPPNAPGTRIMHETAGVRHYTEYPSLTDRYLSFYSRVAERVAEVYPDRYVAGYAYSAYRTPPLYAEAHPKLLIGLVLFNNYGDIDARERSRRAWEGWAQVAEQFFLRPNLFHGRFPAMPAVFTTALARDIRRCYETGMLGTDFDSNMQHWAMQGLNSYVLAHLLWDPSQTADSLVDDYCKKGFGAAGNHVRDYFRRLEQLTEKKVKGGGPLAKYFTPKAVARLQGKRAR